MSSKDQFSTKAAWTADSKPEEHVHSTVLQIVVTFKQCCMSSGLVGIQPNFTPGHIQTDVLQCGQAAKNKHITEVWVHKRYSSAPIALASLLLLLPVIRQTHWLNCLSLMEHNWRPAAARQ